MSLHDEIKALPEWPDAMAVPMNPTAAQEIAYLDTSLTAALDRLALARKWVENNGHPANCEFGAWEVSTPCTCGRDELLAALEPPK